MRLGSTAAAKVVRAFGSNEEYIFDADKVKGWDMFREITSHTLFFPFRLLKALKEHSPGDGWEIDVESFEVR